LLCLLEQDLHLYSCRTNRSVAATSSCGLHCLLELAYWCVFIVWNGMHARHVPLTRIRSLTMWFHGHGHVLFRPSGYRSQTFRTVILLCPSENSRTDVTASLLLFNGMLWWSLLIRFLMLSCWQHARFCDFVAQYTLGHKSVYTFLWFCEKWHDWNAYLPQQGYQLICFDRQHILHT
jgi:hypothetical protein